MKSIKIVYASSTMFRFDYTS